MTFIAPEQSFLKVSFIIAAIAIGIALLPMPYGYYMILRLIMTTISGYAAYLLFQQDKDFLVGTRCHSGLIQSIDTDPFGE
jgi:hypothetical protein